MGKFIEAWRNGQVVRKHIMENIRAENTAEHTWGVVMLMMVAWPNVQANLLKLAMMHDSGERGVGDMPGPTKWKSPILGAEMDRLEREHLEETLPKHLRSYLKDATETDWAIVEFFDRAEFCVSMSRERRLGNTYALIYYQRSFDKMVTTWLAYEEHFKARDPELAEGMNSLYKELREDLNELKEGKF